MILPTKSIGLHSSLLGAGAVLLESIDGTQTRSMLWYAVRNRRSIRTFDRFVFGLDLLFLLGLVRYEDGLIRRNR